MPTNDNLAEVIARCRDALKNAPGHSNTAVRVDDLQVILDAAEAGMRARDEALEEAAAIADRIETKDKPGWQVAEEIEIAIRALKEKP